MGSVYAIINTFSFPVAFREEFVYLFMYLLLIKVIIYLLIEKI